MEKVSGPGKYAQRTDMNTSKQPVRYMSGGNYGEGQELLGLQQGADMAGSPKTAGVPTAADIQRAMMGPRVTNLLAPTERSDEVITQGSRIGAGTGFDPSGLALPEKPSLEETLTAMLPYANDETISFILNEISNSSDVAPGV
jgi:hypothetical protein